MTCGLTWVLFACLTDGVSAQARAVVMIDPGHGGDQAGVTAAGIEEKDLALQASFVLAAEFVARGFDVRLTRHGDYNVPIAERRTEAEEVGAALFISLHFNGDEDSTAHGIELYANLDNSRSANAASSVADALRTLGTPVVVEARSWEFLRSPTVPMLMLEAGFLTNPVERRLLISRAYHLEFATTLVDGSVRFLQSMR